ncbi:LacI family transcriptional regulator [Knoellia remsis]|uniref:LacI family transcriptional regulator n=1 Tax=Knoellia remsis TaxID=407159 RepID=A0A2T0UQV7_9MICO|nr:LacI family transcriptional regulator [Knoellia remsis]
MGIREVAAAAGVSVTTVSHALSGSRSVKAATRERIMAEVARLDYRPDPHARGLRGQRSQLIGLLGDDIVTTPHTSRMVLGAQTAAAEHGCIVVALDPGGDEVVREQQVRYLLDHRVDGVLYAGMYHRELTIPGSLANVPTILLDAHGTDPKQSSVVPDERQIASVAVEHLLEHGHRRIAFVSASQTNDATAVPLREKGFREALRHARVELPRGWVARANADAQGGRTVAHRLLSAPERPTALFCFNDQMAMGAYQAAAALGLSVPGDVSIVGVNNLAIVAGALVPGLTTVGLPHHRMGRWAVERLLRSLDEPDLVPEHLAMPGELVVRDSVAAPRD